MPSKSVCAVNSFLFHQATKQQATSKKSSGCVSGIYFVRKHNGTIFFINLYYFLSALSAVN